MSQHAPAQRLLAVAGAACWLGVAVAVAPGLLHPAETYAPWSSPCDPRGLADAAAYAIGAAVGTLALLAAWKLFRTGATSLSAWGGIGLLVLGFSTRRTSTFGCLAEPTSSASAHRPVASLVLAGIGVLTVVVLWRRGWRTGGQ